MQRATVVPCAVRRFLSDNWTSKETATVYAAAQIGPTSWRLLTTKVPPTSNGIALPTARASEGPVPSASAPAPAVALADVDPKTAAARREEAELLDRCRRGDRLAFRALVEKYQRRVYSLAFGFVRDPDEARDIAQEAFLKVFRHLDTFHGNANFYTWLYRITVNLCIDLRRKSGRTSKSEFDERIAHEDAGSPADCLSPKRLGFDPMRELHNARLREKLQAGLATLSEMHRSVLVLREVEGLSYREIADVLECPEGTVMSRLFHARKQMQEYLQEFSDNPKNTEAARPA